MSRNLTLTALEVSYALLHYSAQDNSTTCVTVNQILRPLVGHKNSGQPSRFATQSTVNDLRERITLYQSTMPKPEPVGSGIELRLYREGLTTKLLTSDKLHVAYVLERSNQAQPDRRWNFHLYNGQTYGTGAPHLLRLLRLQPEQMIQLIPPGSGESIVDIVRLERDKGYVASDPRHIFTWRNREYILSAHRNLGGKDHSCVDRGTGETVVYFKNKVFHRKQEGQLVISSKMQGPDLDVMVAAYLAFREFDERRDMLMFGDTSFNQDVTG